MKSQEEREKIIIIKQQNIKSKIPSNPTNKHVQIATQTKVMAPEWMKTPNKQTNDYPGRTATLSFYQTPQNQKGQQAP